MSEQQTTEGLLKCPFCGGRPIINWEESCNLQHDHNYVSCADCDADSKWCPTPAEAVAAWNRRTP